MNASNDHWDKVLPYVVYHINTTVDSILGISPWNLFHGTEPKELHFVQQTLQHRVNKDTYNLDDCDIQKWEETLRKRQKMAFRKVRDQLLVKKNNWALAKDGETIVPEKGDYVYVDKPSRESKLQKRLTGPYKVIEVSTGGSVLLEHHEELHGKRCRYPIHKLVLIPKESMDREGTQKIKEPTISKDEDKHETELSVLPRRSNRKKPVVNYKQFFLILASIFIPKGLIGIGYCKPFNVEPYYNIHIPNDRSSPSLNYDNSISNLISDEAYNTTGSLVRTTTTANVTTTIVTTSTTTTPDKCYPWYYILTTWWFWAIVLPLVVLCVLGCIISGICSLMCQLGVLLTLLAVAVIAFILYFP